MADFVNVASLTYCGKEAQEIFSKSVSNLPLAGYGITSMHNVKGKQKIYLFPKRIYLNLKKVNIIIMN